jgi:hypothetical protein
MGFDEPIARGRIVVEQNQHLSSGVLHTEVHTTGKPEVVFRPHDFDGRPAVGSHVGTAVGRPVVDQHHFDIRSL